MGGDWGLDPPRCPEEPRRGPARRLHALRAHFADLPDPRIDRCKRHALLDVVTIAFCAVVCGADTWVDVAEFGRSKQAWLRTFLGLPNGVPSHDTFGRVFAAPRDTRTRPPSRRRSWVGFRPPRSLPASTITRTLSHEYTDQTFELGAPLTKPVASGSGLPAEAIGLATPHAHLRQC